MEPLRQLGRIAVRIAPLPAPGAFQNDVQIRILWLPAEFGADALGTRHRAHLIAWPPWSLVDGQRSPGDAPRALDDLAHRVSLPIAQIVDAQPRLCAAERLDVRLRQIEDMDI